MKHSKIRIVLFSLVAISILMISHSWAAVTWTGTTSSSWDEPANWIDESETERVPEPVDDVVIIFSQMPV